MKKAGNRHANTRSRIWPDLLDFLHAEWRKNPE